MNDRYLLDTNIVIGLFEGDPEISEAFGHVAYAALNVVVYAELLAGALRSTRVTENVGRLERFSRSVPLLDCDRETAAAFAGLSVDLRRKGTPIPENDIWIAATARQHRLVLATRDRHFDHVEGLELARW
ncbi:MAG: type II toxin-antitoxin system VapC family toxin [Acidobacteriales bacterium]|nr:type II toxin-antitoxin system VapC family toxin [Terriglobales bacterium]